jgi:hypothetical protein
MLSPGMWIAMRSGELLADLIPMSPVPASNLGNEMADYERRMKLLLSSWQQLVSSFCDGNLMASYFGRP